jgi:hypothetical protein
MTETDKPMSAIDVGGKLARPHHSVRSKLGLSIKGA